MKIIEIIADPLRCAEYLASLSLPCLTADPKPPRSPPEPEEFDDPFPPD